MLSKRFFRVLNLALVLALLLLLGRIALQAKFEATDNVQTLATGESLAPVHTEPEHQDQPDEELFRFVVLGDSHGDEDQYPLLLSQVRAEDPAFVVHVGDVTKVGGRDELEQAKADLDSMGLPYYVIPGDHDIVRGKGTSWFEEEFGEPYQTIDYEGYRLVLIDNSEQQEGMGAEQMTWLGSIKNSQMPFMVFMHYPIEHPFIRSHTMQETTQGKQDADRLLEILHDQKVVAFFAGEMHIYQRLSIEGTPMYVVGAAGQYSNPEGLQYALARVTGQGSVSVERRFFESAERD